MRDLTKYILTGLAVSAGSLTPGLAPAQSGAWYPGYEYGVSAFSPGSYIIDQNYARSGYYGSSYGYGSKYGYSNRNSRYRNYDSYDRYDKYDRSSRYRNDSYGTNYKSGSSLRYRYPSGTPGRYYNPTDMLSSRYY